MDDEGELRVGHRVILSLGAEVRHGVIESLDPDGEHATLELTDSIEAGRSVRAPLSSLRRAPDG